MNESSKEMAGEFWEYVKDHAVIDTVPEDLDKIEKYFDSDGVSCLGTSKGLCTIIIDGYWYKAPVSGVLQRARNFCE